MGAWEDWVLTPWDACLRDDRAKALRAQAVHQQPAVCMPLHVLALVATRIDTIGGACATDI